MEENELMKCSGIYSFFDRNGDNNIPITELKRMLVSYGLNLSNEEATIIMQDFQK